MYEPKDIDGIRSAPVLFVRKYRVWNEGDLAWFPIVEATSLIARGFAKRPGQSEEQKPEIADGAVVNRATPPMKRRAKRNK